MTAAAPAVSAPADASAAGRMDALASLRFLCLLLIVARHYAVYLGDVSPALAAAVGRIDASEFFFFASGYLRHAAARRTPGSATLAPVGRQLARLYPLHLATTLFFVAGVLLLGMTGSLHGESLGRCLVVNLALLQAWGLLSQLCLNFPSWFLSAIFGMYLLYPLLGRLVAGAPWAALALLCGIVAVFESAAPVLGARDWLSWTYDGGGLRAVPSFLAGALLAESGLRGSWRLPSVVPAIVLLAASVAASLTGFAPLIAKFALQGLALVAIVAAERDGAGGWLGNRALAGWDAASFPLFLLHAPVAAVLMNVVAIRLLGLDGTALMPALLVTLLTALIAARLYAAATRRAA